MKHGIFVFLICCLFLFQNCTQRPREEKPVTKTDSTSKNSSLPIANEPIADAATIVSRKEVPVLCFHHIREWHPNESASMKDYIVPPATFKDQIKILADSGYHTILPDQLYAYLTTGAQLPSKPIVITFDDTDEEQYTIGATEMEKYGFKGVYFIMSISIGRPHYMSKEQLKELSDKGHTIAAHTWDHHNVKQYVEKDYDVQFTTPKQKLETIIGKPVDYFAYPFGLWNEAAITELNKRGYKAAFQLSTKIDPKEPLYTIRRILVPGTWSATAMLKAIKNSFH